MFVPYIGNLPNPPDNPSVDVPGMQINTNGVENILAIDHIGFNANNGGWHLQSHYQQQALGANPPVTPAGFNTVYSQVVTVTGVGFEGELFYTQGNANPLLQPKYQLTGPFVPQPANPGWSFMAGGIFVQWGTVPSGGAGNRNGTFVFTAGGGVAFPNNCFILQLTLINSANPGQSASISYRNLTNLQFDWQINTGSANIASFAYLAIGN